jgi:hypothetical protein
MHRNGQIIQQYPYRFIKQEYQNKIALENNQYLKDKHPNIPDIHFDFTFKLANTFPKENFLDSRFMFEHKFRLKLQNRSLSTKSNLQKRNIVTDNRCPNCDHPETIDHLWQCPNTMQKLPEIHTGFINNLETRYQKDETTLDLTKIQTVRDIINSLQIQPGHIKHTNAIITQSMITELEHIHWASSTHPLLKGKSKTDLLLIILDCWYNALYRTIWIPRNQQTYRN